MKSLFLAGLVILMGSVSATSVLAAPLFSSKTITCVTDANATYWAPKKIEVTIVYKDYYYDLSSVVVDGTTYTKSSGVSVTNDGEVYLTINKFAGYNSLGLTITDSGSSNYFLPAGQKSSMTCN